jgi:hypothetical protein
MNNYLGETILDIHQTKYALYSQEAWVLLWIEMYGGIDGSQHKDWLLDQIVRILHGTKVIVKLAKWDNGYEEERFILDEPTQDYYDYISNISGYNVGIAP